MCILTGSLELTKCEWQYNLSSGYSYIIDDINIRDIQYNTPTGDTPVNPGQHTATLTVSQEAPAGLGRRERPPTLQSAKSVRSPWSFQCLSV